MIPEHLCDLQGSLSATFEGNTALTVADLRMPCQGAPSGVLARDR